MVELLEPVTRDWDFPRDAAGIALRVPRPGLCTDNGAMVAALGAQLERRGRPESALDLPVDSALPVTTVQL